MRREARKGENFVSPVRRAHGKGVMTFEGKVVNEDGRIRTLVRETVVGDGNSSEVYNYVLNDSVTIENGQGQIDEGAKTTLECISREGKEVLVEAMKQMIPVGDYAIKKPPYLGIEVTGYGIGVNPDSDDSVEGLIIYHEKGKGLPRTVGVSRAVRRLGKLF